MDANVNGMRHGALGKCAGKMGIALKKTSKNPIETLGIDRYSVFIMIIIQQSNSTSNIGYQGSVCNAIIIGYSIYIPRKIP